MMDRTVERRTAASRGAADSFGRYLDQIGRYPLLTPQQEIMLSRQVQRAVELEQLDRPLTPQEKREHARGLKAEQRIIVCNLRLVVTIARKYIGRTQSSTMDDLVQLGSLGLCHAVRKFDHERGYKFSTYCYWWIRQSITRGIIDTDRMVRLPVHVDEQASRLYHAGQDLIRELGRMPTPAEVADRVGMTVEQVQNLARWRVRVASTDALVSDDSTLGELQAAPGPDPTTMWVQGLMEELAPLIDQLPADDRRMLQLRYGLIDGVQHTLDAIGKQYGVTRERIRQRVVRSERRLRLMLATSQPSR
jgi:RNA polymerase sigma factor (sigma-70 family)